MSPMQQEQMQKQEGDNVNVTAIRGNFDDAQQFLKRLFVDESMAEKVAAKGVRFSSANSINVGRLAPQVVYYVAAYAELVNRVLFIAMKCLMWWSLPATSAIFWPLIMRKRWVCQSVS